MVRGYQPIATADDDAGLNVLRCRVRILGVKALPKENHRVIKAGEGGGGEGGDNNSPSMSWFKNILIPNLQRQKIDSRPARSAGFLLYNYIYVLLRKPSGEGKLLKSPIS